MPMLEIMAATTLYAASGRLIPFNKFGSRLTPSGKRIWRRNLGKGPLTVKVGAFSLPGVQRIASDIHDGNECV
jgi:hypothetical protein